MPGNALTTSLKLWAAACLGCAFFLLASCLPQGAPSIALLSQLSWLSVVGSVPAALVLGAAARSAQGSVRAIALSTLLAMLLAAAIGWEHTDFLLSGPHWALHPQRRLARFGMLLTLSALGAGGWLWLILGARIEHRARLATWVACTLSLVAILTAAMVRYRAYDYSMAQLVFPAAVLCSALLYRLTRDSKHWPLVLGAATACLLCGAGSRFFPPLIRTGQREVTAYSRAGALATLYILPPRQSEEAWTATGNACPDPRPRIEESEIGIEPGSRRNVIIVTVDALRRDLVGAEARGQAVTPELSRFAKRGVSFANATSTYPATLFAMGSAFTGLSPAELYLSPALPDTVFSRTRAQVDRQFAVLPDVSWFRLPIVEQFLASGVATDFAPSDAAATDALIERLRQARSDEASVMAWLHYYSPHDPYLPQDGFSFGRGQRNAYLSEVAYFDHQFGRLMRYLEKDGWLDDSLLIFFSDHGEALGEKAYWGHHVYLDGWMVDVPLTLWHAELDPSEPQVGVSLADVAPTVLHFLGLPIPSDIPAQSLFSLEPSLRGRATFSEAFPVRGKELFDSFRLPALDDATIRARLRSIRVASKGYEPKAAISKSGYRLIEHRSARTRLFYDRETKASEQADGGEVPQEVKDLLESEFERWEQAQLRRIECRLELSEGPSETPRPR